VHALVTALDGGLPVAEVDVHQGEDGERQAAHQWPTFAAGDGFSQQFDGTVGVSAQRV
jgi:hypothetical protein